MATFCDPGSCHVGYTSKQDDLIESRTGAIAVGKRGKPMKALRVLVVEDEAVIARLLAEVLAGLGYEICAIVSTVAATVAAAARCRPDLMIVDAGLRDGSGLSAVQEILRAGFVPHLFISGDISTVRTLRPDAVVMQKPFSEAELVHAIQRALDTTKESSVAATPFCLTEVGDPSSADVSRTGLSRFRACRSVLAVTNFSITSPKAHLTDKASN